MQVTWPIYATNTIQHPFMAFQLHDIGNFQIAKFANIIPTTISNTIIQGNTVWGRDSSLYSNSQYAVYYLERFHYFNQSC